MTTEHNLKLGGGGPLEEGPVENYRLSVALRPLTFHETCPFQSNASEHERNLAFTLKIKLQGGFLICPTQKKYGTGPTQLGVGDVHFS